MPQPSFYVNGKIGTNNAYIPSVTITVPRLYVSKCNTGVKYFIVSNNLGNYFYYGRFALFKINMGVFDNSIPVWDNIWLFLNYLRYQTIVSPLLPDESIRLDEIRLCFEIPVPGAIFCNTRRFRKIGNIFKSTDYHQFLRNKGLKNAMSKGIQRSFISVHQFECGSNVILTYSGKYRRHISIDLLKLNPVILIKHLISMGSVYLTRATNPECLKISEGAIRYLPPDFQELLNGANWYKKPFRIKNMTTNFIGGPNANI
jgi:hypothetical protein